MGKMAVGDGCLGVGGRRRRRATAARRVLPAPPSPSQCPSGPRAKRAAVGGRGRPRGAPAPRHGRLQGGQAGAGGGVGVSREGRRDSSAARSTCGHTPPASSRMSSLSHAQPTRPPRRRRQVLGVEPEAQPLRRAAAHELEGAVGRVVGAHAAAAAAVVEAVQVGVQVGAGLARLAGGGQLVSQPQAQLLRAAGGAGGRLPRRRRQAANRALRGGVHEPAGQTARCANRRTLSAAAGSCACASRAARDAPSGTTHRPHSLPQPQAQGAAWKAAGSCRYQAASSLEWAANRRSTAAVAWLYTIR